MIEHFVRPDGQGQANGYSDAAAGTGRLVAVSGQLPIDGDGKIVDTSDALIQARQVFANLAAALRAAGANPEDVLRLTFYLTDLADLGAVRAARDEFVGQRTPPASTLIQVAGLLIPEARIEIDALAVTAP
jgi:enamine deaminase RidA (YjgF/YER057c/UK114 family)